MDSFWTRFARLNADFLIGWLESLFPGPSIGGAVIFNTEGDAAVGEITVTDTETTLRATITPLDAEGQPTTTDEVPEWTVGDESVLTATPADDGLSATFAVGNPGASAVTAAWTQTDDAGAETEIVLTGLVTVLAGEAVGGSVEFATG